MQAGNDILISHGFEDELNTCSCYVLVVLVYKTEKIINLCWKYKEVKSLKHIAWFFLSFLGLPKHANFWGINSSATWFVL